MSDEPTTPKIDWRTMRMFDVQYPPGQGIRGGVTGVQPIPEQSKRGHKRWLAGLTDAEADRLNVRR